MEKAAVGENFGRIVLVGKGLMALQAEEGLLSN